MSCRYGRWFHLALHNKRRKMRKWTDKQLEKAYYDGYKDKEKEILEIIDKIDKKYEEGQSWILDKLKQKIKEEK